MRKIWLLVVALLGGCYQADPHSVDQCLRREIFKECMAALPKGPSHTVTNDWAEVVDSCKSAARYQSIRKKSQIKLECLP